LTFRVRNINFISYESDGLPNVALVKTISKADDMRNTVIYLLLAAVIASAQSKQRVAVLPSVGDLEPQGLILLTDKVREIATKNLPINDFNILKQDAITKMIGEEELYRSCKEGVCIGDLAKKTNANYGARCDVIRFENSLVLKFEIYSVNDDAIFETFTDYDVNDFRGMLAVLETRLPDVFKKMVVSLKAQNDLTQVVGQAVGQALGQAAQNISQAMENISDGEQAKTRPEKVVAGSARVKPKPVVIDIDKSMDFTTGERWGTWALNVVPGLGSAVIMKDTKGAIINAAMGVGGGALALGGAWGIPFGFGIQTVQVTTGITMWLGVASAWNIYRSATYHHPDSRQIAANPLQGVNVAVLPDQDGNIKSYVAYRMEF
jgi:hypothetical protein